VQYLAVIHADEARWDALSDAERAEAMEGYGALSRESVVVDGNELDSTDTATTVRVREGETLVTDGPFAELKEQIGGYYVLDCDSIEDACAWAARIPAASHGAIEVRPVHVDEEEQS
jgi:hypothetical protein